MRFIVRIFAFCIFTAGIATAQQYDVSLEKKSNYNNWGTSWDSVVVLKNGIVTIAAVPKIGGRVMQYDLGTHPSIYIHESMKGKNITSGDSMIGGFRQLPSPQSDFQWPSPPKVDFGAYTCTVLQKNADSAVISLLSPIEDSNLDKYKTHKGLQFKRDITLYKGSTRVKVVMTMYNKGQQSMTHGIWDITQSSCSNNDTADLENFWIYFQRYEQSTLGGNKGYVQYKNEGTGAGAQWIPDAAPGNIMGIQFKKLRGKIGADCRAGWICFNDRYDAYAYVKTFTYATGKNYPDSGASVQVYTYPNMNMLEVEVLGPLTTIAPGDSVTLEENWYAARSNGPVLAINAAGLTTKKMTVGQSNDSLAVNGTFGVFYQGYVKMQFCDASKTVVSTVDSVPVTPTDSFYVNKKLKIPAGAAYIHLTAFDSKGTAVGILDSAAVPSPLSNGKGLQPQVSSITAHSITAQVENSAIMINVPNEGTYQITLHTIDGKQIGSRTVNAPCRFAMMHGKLTGNVVIIMVNGKGVNESKRLIVSRMQDLSR
jgi:hypothetical protein